MSRYFAAFSLALAMVGFANPPANAQIGGSAVSTLQRNSTFARTNVLNNPTVSPYLRLLQNGGNAQAGIGGAGGAAAVYQTQVRPQLERRQQDAQQQRQIQQIQNDLNQVRTQFTQPNSGYMATGHPTRYMTYSHYYPAMGR